MTLIIERQSTDIRREINILFEEIIRVYLGEVKMFLYSVVQKVKEIDRILETHSYQVSPAPAYEVQVIIVHQTGSFQHPNWFLGKIGFLLSLKNGFFNFRLLLSP